MQTAKLSRLQTPREQRIFAPRPDFKVEAVTRQVFVHSASGITFKDRNGMNGVRSAALSLPRVRFLEKESA